MSNTPMDSTWWRASDGKWYPAHTHPGYSTGPSVTGAAGSGPAEIIERKRREIEFAQKGIEGEQATADALRAHLPSEFRVLHGLRKGPRGGDIDHVVIGPTGVWVIDTKNVESVTTQSGAWRQGRYSVFEMADKVEDQAAYARFALGLEANPVLCFVRAQLPRPAQMVGRTRVLALSALPTHIASGPVTLPPDQLRQAIQRAEQWARQPPAMPSTRRTASAGSMPVTSFQPPPMPAPVVPRNRSWIPLTIVLATVALVVGACGFAALFLGKAAENVAGRVTVETSTTTVPAGAEYLKVQIDCPIPGSGFEVQPRTTINARQIHLSATVNGVPQYLGQFRAYQPIEPIRALAPNVPIAFDLLLVDDVGQLGESFRIDVTTPPSPC